MWRRFIASQRLGIPQIGKPLLQCFDVLFQPCNILLLAEQLFVKLFERLVLYGEKRFKLDNSILHAGTLTDPPAMWERFHGNLH